MASLYLSRKIKNIIMIGVIVIALIIAFNKSNIINAFLKPSDVMGHAPKEANELFEESKYNSKLKLQYIAPNVKEIKQDIFNILTENQLKIMYSKSSSNNCTWLIEIPADDYKKIIDKLRILKEPNQEELIQKDDQLLSGSIEERIKDNERRKEILNEGFQNARTAYDQENYNRNILKTEKIIDSLKTIQHNQKKYSNNIFAKIDVSHFVSRADVTEYALKSFLTTFVISLLFISVALFVIYFIIRGFTKLFSVLGIKTTHGEQSRYSGYGGYGRYGSSSYGYGYDYGSRKKIKRKYIRKPKSEVEEHLEKNESEDKDKK